MENNIIDNKEPIDLIEPDLIEPRDLEHKKLFQDLQGNILKGHGRYCAVYFFLRFPFDESDESEVNARREKTKQWIKWLVKEGYVTSTAKQFEHAKKHRNAGGKASIPGPDSPLFGNFFLSYRGYEVLKVSQSKIPQDKENSFKKMKDAGVSLGDDYNDDNWDKAYDEIHAAVLLAHDDEDKLKEAANLLRNKIKEEIDRDSIVIVKEEFGKAIIRRGKDSNFRLKENVYEHFGFADNISQPLFFRRDINVRDRNSSLSLPSKSAVQFDVYNPFAPLNLVLVKDLTSPLEESYGSFMVLRKLEQNVDEFNRSVSELAAKLGLQGGLAAERAAARIIGRFRDGTPLTLQDSPGMDNPIPNLFTYNTNKDLYNTRSGSDYKTYDSLGSRCPVHAHIRKMNPRGQTAFGDIDKLKDVERMRRIVRRGITYGKPGEERGLLFMCFQSSIVNQFEHLQKIWANDEMFPLNQGGIDPLIGQKLDEQDKKEKPNEQYWPPDWDRQADIYELKRHLIHDVIKLKGGEYFFAPSISTLENIS